MEYFAFQWHITDSCDQRCRHCYIFSENNHTNLKEMSWTEIESVFKNCLDMCKKANRIPYFYITGGDPILHSSFWDLMELFKAHKIAFTILGNSFHLNAEVCRKLKDYGCERYQLSIDGLRATHDAMRKKGTLDNFYPIKDLQSGVYLTGFSSNYPTQIIINDIFEHIHKHKLHPVISKVFSLDEIGQAHKLMENNTANEKVIVKI